MPKPEDYKAGERVIETISSFKGDVYIPFHSNYQVMAGKKLFVHKMPIDDLYIGYKEKFPTALLEKISKKEFSAIIYDWDISPATGNPVEQAITKYYNKNTVIPYQNPYTFMPVSGLKVRPQIIYVPGKEE